MIKIYHITHNDADAVGCDVVLRLNFKNVPDCSIYTHWCSYKTISDTIVDIAKRLDTDIKISGDNDDKFLLIISDISPAKNTEGYLVLKELFKEQALVNSGVYDNDDKKHKIINTWMFDHHKTNPFMEYGGADDHVKIVTDGCPTHISAAYVMFSSLLHSIGTLNIKGYITTNSSELISSSKEPTSYYLQDILKTPGKINFIHKFVTDISRYDTWEWIKNPSTLGGEDAVTNILRHVLPAILSEDLTNYLYELTEKSPAEYSPSNKYPELDNISCFDYLPKEYIIYHRLAVDDFDKYMYNIEHKVKISCSGEYLYGIILCDNTNINMSLVTDIINRNRLPFVLDYIVILYPTTRTISFRTVKDTVDVSRIAKRCYNGGGHREAAGAKVDIPTFSSFLIEYWTSKSLHDIEDNFSIIIDYTNPESTSNAILDFIKSDEDEE